MSEAAARKVYYKEKELNEIRDEIENYRLKNNDPGFTKGHEYVAKILRSKNKKFITKNLNGKKVGRIWMNYFDPKFNRGPATEEEYIILGDAKRSGKRIVLTKILPNRTGQWVANLLINPQFLQWYSSHNSELTPELVQASTVSVGRSGEVFSQLHPAEELSPPASPITYAQYIEDEDIFFIDDRNDNPANFDTPFMLDPSITSDYRTLSESVGRPESESGDWDDTYSFFTSQSVGRGGQGGNRMKSFIKARKSSRKAHKKSSRKARKSSRKARKSSRK
jgi:hypothetical protein